MGRNKVDFRKVIALLVIAFLSFNATAQSTVGDPVLAIPDTGALRDIVTCYPAPVFREPLYVLPVTQYYTHKKSRVAYRPNLRRLGIVLSAGFSGGAWGVHEATMHKWPEVQKKHPGLNPEYWNPAESWRNKYVNGDPAQGRKRFAGVVIPVHLTDAKHALASGAFISGFAAGGFTLSNARRQPVWHTLADIGLSFIAYTAGNYLTYNVIMR